MKIFLVLALTLSSLAANPFKNTWYSGAEINSYELKQTRYGNSHPGHVELIFVTENFLPDRQVKDESGSKQAVPIFKLNVLSTFNTGIYSYRTMLSIFQRVDTKNFQLPLKTTCSIQDWCGHAYQQFNLREKHWDFRLHSYFEKFADTSKEIAHTPLEDGLWTQLRMNPKQLPTGKIQLIPGAVFSRFHHIETKPYAANAKFLNGKKTSTYQIDYPELQRKLSIKFDTAFPHIIRGWTEKTTQGTTTATLKKRLMNNPYWNFNRPQDAKKRKLLGLDPITN